MHEILFIYFLRHVLTLKVGNEHYERNEKEHDCLDPELLSHLTKSLVRLSTNHTEIIANETVQLRRLLDNTSLNDDVRVRKIFLAL